MQSGQVRLAVVMDPIGAIKPAKDTTLAMLLAAQRRGWSVEYLELRDLWLRDAPILLLDEPTSGLDDLNTQVIAHTLREYVVAPRISVICSHDSRLTAIAHEVLDFNRFLPLEGHLVALAGTAE